MNRVTDLPAEANPILANGLSPAPTDITYRPPVTSHRTALTYASFVSLAVILAYAAVLTLEHRTYLMIFRLNLVHFSVVSIVVLLGTSGLYFNAARFYKDQFYLLAGVGWLANAIYMSLEAFAPGVRNDLSRNLDIYFFSLVTLVPFCLASYTYPEKPVHPAKTSPRSLLAAALGWPFIIILTRWGGGWILQRYWPSTGPEYRFLLYTAGGQAFAVWTLVRTSRTLALRLSQEVHGKWAIIFPATFYVYGAIQVLYPFKLLPSWHGVVSAAFIVALLAKIINSIAALSVNRYDFANLRERVEARSIFEDIGVLTASIEHEMKNPIQNLYTAISTMRQKFLANQEVVSGLAKLEHHLYRIEATTRIIPQLRASEKFFGHSTAKISVGDLVNRSIKSVKIEMGFGEISVVPSNKVMYIRAYAPMIQQALVNVLKNAVEAIREAQREEGRITVEIKDSHDAAHRVIVSIKDNGCGISPENLPKLATLFTTKSDRKANSGIGLFITSRILRLHHGDFNVESDVGKGTTVHLRFPG